jgi:fatty acid desaturase
MEATQVRPAPKQQRYAVRPWAFGFKISVWFGLSAFAVFGIALADGVVKLPFQILLAAMFAHGVELAHQALHRTGFGVAKFERIAGVVLCIPTLISFSLYQFLHLRHHKTNGAPNDQESFGYWFELMKSPHLVVRCVGFSLHFSMVVHFATAIVRVCGAFTGYLAVSLKKDGLPAASITKTIIEYRLMGCLIALAAIFGLTVNFQAVIDFWVMPLALFAAIHALIELPEHFGCDHPSEDGRKNTRSIRAGRFMTWFTNGNCFHVGHHLEMRIPMDYRLAQYENTLREEQPFKHDSMSYFEFYVQVVNFILTGKGLGNA